MPFKPGPQIVDSESRGGWVFITEACRQDGAVARGDRGVRSRAEEVGRGTGVGRAIQQQLFGSVPACDARAAPAQAAGARQSGTAGFTSSILI
jgi:hypothetical protein